jgi:hypothetical protein
MLLLVEVCDCLVHTVVYKENVQIRAYAYLQMVMRMIIS